MGKRNTLMTSAPRRRSAGEVPVAVRVVEARKEVPLARGTGKYGVGSDLSNQIHLSDGYVSAYHCVLERIDGRVVVRDCGSTNGTWVNGLRVRETEVAAGMRLIVG